MEQWIKDWKVGTREIDAFGEPPKSEPDWHLHAGGVCSPVNDSEGGGQRSEVKVGERSEIASAIRSQAVVTADEPSQFLIFSEFLLSNA